MLLTRSRLCPRASPGSSLHLHVLSTPPAFVLSQDQTLREELHEKLSWSYMISALRWRSVSRNPYTRLRDHDGVLLSYLTQFVHPRDRSEIDSAYRADPVVGRTWTHTTIEDRSSVRMLLSFQRPSSLVRKGFSSEETDPTPSALRRRLRADRGV